MIHVEVAVCVQGFHHLFSRQQSYRFALPHLANLNPITNEAWLPEENALAALHRSQRLYRRLGHGDDIYGLTQYIEHFEDITFFDAVWVGNSVNQRGDISSLEVVVGRVSIE
ncbi:MAG: hypothetical protein WBA43_25235 [Elainellaceae cyanobacterium]